MKTQLNSQAPDISNEIPQTAAAAVPRRLTV
jgi:hypothetical protein